MSTRSRTPPLWFFSFFLKTLLITVIYCFHKIPNLKYWPIWSHPSKKKKWQADAKFFLSWFQRISWHTRLVKERVGIEEGSGEGNPRMSLRQRQDTLFSYRETALPRTLGCISEREFYLMFSLIHLFYPLMDLLSRALNASPVSRYKHDKNCFKKINKHLSVWQLLDFLLYHLLSSLMLNRRNLPVKYSYADLADITHHSLIQFF